VSPLLKAREIYIENGLVFQQISRLYKSMLDKNFGGRFCIGEHCSAIFIVEIRQEDSEWGATPKIFYNEEQTKGEAERLKTKYPFICECRVIMRKMEEEREKD
jgi:hypothetical protein